ncbi:uncharacterized protein LOC122195002 [Lactuca sativa]|uniref:uncharacterized protein LOC122195002 n=1 Tax=Lactuca sativa TaxID=4236 RepID=UPI000CB028E3|nr:uncharacterized protein LOC122195002 [Lactuca sativa]
MAKTRSMTRNHNHDDDHASSSSSRKRFKTFDKGGVAPWSNLNHDVLFLVMMELGMVDFLAFGGVCKSWRSFAASNRNMFMASKPPMKTCIDPHDNNKDFYFYMEDFERRRFKTIIPHSAGSTCFGLTCGYLILYGRETHNFWLVNPITKHELHFPDYPFFSIANEEEMRAILVFSPSMSRWVFVILHRLIKIISFCIAGKRGWNHVSCTHPIDSPLAIVDLHVFKGKIYTLQSDFSLAELRLDPNQEQKWTLLEINNFPKPDLLHLELVSSGENLYVISRISALNKVMELDFVKTKWVKPEKIIREYVFFHSRLKSSAAIKRTQYKSYDYFNGTAERKQRMLFYATMWYFPHDCLNVNLLDE